MQIPGVTLDLYRMPGPLPIWHGSVDTNQWLAAARAVSAAAGRLVSLWATPGDGPDSVSVCYATRDGLVWLTLSLAAGEPQFPDLAPLFPCASRMQRAAADLSAIRAADCEDQRPWLDHGAWPARFVPLHRSARYDRDAPVGEPSDYSFVRVQGDGVHEIPVGPVHAGIIEPGHFRFSIVGEEVLRLEERLGYTHKGIERRFTQLPPQEGHRLAGRVSGDSTVAYAWAYCMALESAASCTPPERAVWLRALMLERERVANHLGDLGALANDVAFSFGLAQFSRMREDWSRLSKSAFGHRFMMDCIVPGGVTVEFNMGDQVTRQCDSIERDVNLLRSIYEDHSGLQDRFMGAGVVTSALAARLGLTGLAGRASGQAADLRCDHPWPPYDTLKPRMALRETGDVAARVLLRFDELLESLRLIRAIVRRLPAGPTCADLHMAPNEMSGMGWVEGWRGEIVVALTVDGATNRIMRCHCHDPSWQNWPVLEHAVIDNIVPDFPLINKSFNLSYSGHDL